MSEARDASHGLTLVLLGRARHLLLVWFLGVLPHLLRGLLRWHAVAWLLSAASFDHDLQAVEVLA